MVNIKLKYNFVETPRKFIIAELSIRKLGSSSVLIIMHYYRKLCDNKLTWCFHKIILKSVDILQQTCYQQADIRMRSHGLRQLVDDKSVAIRSLYVRLLRTYCDNNFTWCFHKIIL